MKVEDSGEARLLRLGLQPEFKREFTLLTNFGISFSIISVLTGIGGSLQIAWNNSGPAAAIWGWTIVSVATMLIGLSMGEIASGLPSSGGPYFWSSWLAGSHGAFFSFLTGWCNLLGQTAVTASVAFSTMLVIASMVLLLFSHALNTFQQLATYAGVLVLAGAINSLSPRVMARVIAFSIFWHISGVIFLVLLLPTVAPWHQNAEFVWATFFDYSKSSSGITNNLYLFLQGCLMAQFTIIGYDSCGHMSEETRVADSTAPYAIVLSIGASSVLGYILLIGLLMSIQDPWTLTDPNSEGGGFALGQLLYDVFNARFGNGDVGSYTLLIFVVAMTLCTTASVTANSRMVFAFARDHGIPFSRFFRVIHSQTNTPLRTVWLSVLLAFLFGLPLMKSSIAFSAVVSVCTMGLQISYGIPIFFRLTVSKYSFERGPFHLGRFSQPVGWLAIAWIIFSAVNFSLPPAYPITLETFNFAPAALGAILVGASLAWVMPGCGMRHKFEGPRISFEKQEQGQYSYINDDGGA